MNIISVINAKGGCGKSTIAVSLATGLARRGQKTLLIDMDPQAQATQWLDAGDCLQSEGTLTAAMAGMQPLHEVIQSTSIPGLSVVASSEGLEELGRQIMDHETYYSILARLLADPRNGQFDYAVIDSPNQISPIMENVIYPTDLFVVPFESTKAVKSYANFFKLVLSLRPNENHHFLHVLSNLTRQLGLRKRVIQALERDRIALADTEVRSCGWLAQIDEHGGSIFDYRPRSNGAEDIHRLINEIIVTLQRRDAEKIIV